jgi:glycerophosphoryl diester phosphodiesterase
VVTLRHIVRASVLVATIVGCAGNVMGLRPKAPFAALGPGPLIIAHRGGSLEAPENTLASLKHGVMCGADWQEVDVTLSRDDKLVIIHDDTLERTTNGKGLVENFLLSDLLKLDAGHPHWSKEARDHLAAEGVEHVPDFGNAYPRERIPTLEEALKLPGTRLMIELKKSAHPAKLARQVVQAVHDARASDRVLLGSFEVDLVEAVYQLDPSLPLIGIIEDPAMFENMLDLPISVLGVSTELAGKALEVAPPGVAVWTWTVYTVDAARVLAEGGVHGLITDIPRALVQALREQTQPAPLARR